MSEEKRKVKIVKKVRKTVRDGKYIVKEDDVILDNVVPDNVITENVITDNVVPDNVILENAITENTVKLELFNQTTKITMDIDMSKLPLTTIDFIKENNYKINMNVELTVEGIKLLNDIMSKRNIEVSSFKTLFITLNMVNTLNIPNEYISINIPYEKMILMTEPEYMFCVYAYGISKYNEKFYDAQEYVQKVENPYDDMVKALDLDILDFKAKSIMLKFYDNVPVGKRKSILKNKYIKYFTTQIPEIYFEKVEQDVYKCDKVSKTEKYLEGERVNVDIFEFTKRFNQYTENMFNRDGKTFPWDVAIVAGGFVSLLLDVKVNMLNFRNADVDIFVIGKEGESKKDSFKRVIDWFNIPDRTVYSVVGAVCNVYVPKSSRDSLGADRFFQIISVNSSNYWTVISRFDLSHIQVCYDGNAVYSTYKAIDAMSTRITSYSNFDRMRFNRALKTLYRGWNIKKEKIISDEFPMLNIVCENPQDPMVQKEIRKLHSYNFPHIENSFVSEDEKYNLLDVMDMYSNGTIITMEMSKVIDNIIIGANFDVNYDVFCYKNFKMDALVKNDVRNRDIYTLKNKLGILKFTSDECKVISLTNDESLYTIKLQTLTTEFAKFLHNMDVVIYEYLYKKKSPEKPILDKHNEFVVELRATKYRKYTKVVLKNNNLEELNIDEDLKIDDVVKMMFTLEVHDSSHFVIKPQFLIKTVAENITPESVTIIDKKEENKQIDYTERKFS
jgi:hypothetical protein